MRAIIVKEIPIDAIAVSEYNTRKDLADGQIDSTIDDLARSIATQGLLNPITVYQLANDAYALVAGQRRYLACRQLGLSTIAAIVRETMDGADATALSLVENVHRADMNPRDKATAFQALLERLGTVQAVSRETGVGVATIRKYLTLLDLAPTLLDRLAAGEATHTEALSHLAQRISDPDAQLDVWQKIGGFTQSVQRDIIKRLDPNVHNLDELTDQAVEGAFDYHMVRKCPDDCPSIPNALKAHVAAMIATAQQLEPHAPIPVSS